MPLVDRIASGVVTAVPPVLLAIGMWFGWAGKLLDWRDLLVLVLSYGVIGLTALLWGGAAGIFLLHHATFSINSLCHFFGRRDFATDDESRNLAWLAIPTWGEAWHNNHHAFPRAGRRAVT
jgi:fatty-acid desaturase